MELNVKATATYWGAMILIKTILKGLGKRGQKDKAYEGHVVTQTVDTYLKTIRDSNKHEALSPVPKKKTVYG